MTINGTPIKILFWLDVEDFVSEESEAGLEGLLDLLDSRGITGIFKLVGEKIRMLERRGRHDLIRRLKAHEVGYHTDLHSVHPVTTEYLEPLGFREGAEEFERREGGGFEDLLRITEQPALCYGQPGLAWAPHPFAVLRKWGIPVYLDSHNQVDYGGRPFWYGGLLNMTALTGIMSIPLKEDMLESGKRKFHELCDAQMDEEIGFISLFYHPTEFVFSEFWDAVNFAKGNNPPREEWVKPKQHPEGKMAFYLEQFGLFLDYTLSLEHVEYIGIQQLLAMEKSNSRMLTKEEIRGFAAQVRTDLNYGELGDLTLSPGELFWVFRQYLLGEEPIPELIYGPEKAFEPVSNQTTGGAAAIEKKVDAEPRTFTASAIMQAISQDLPTVCGFKQMPNAFVIGGEPVNPVSVTCAMATMIRDNVAPNEEVELMEGRLAAADYAANDGEWSRYWVIFPESLQVRNIVEMSRLQAWTFKPALF
ncbi:hypothetical protein [Paenibacillus sp. HB172176]|uniref:hypothetical protein n=1 Tax=Paenibacillus sp. HB172176 TaxID=2493690 RepID=UPI00143931E2|nr:hypothetical protein [Paenibacillus sp. HB172176]